MQLLDYFKDLTVHPKNAEELKGLILQLAIQGKLTAQWRKENPDVEPASVLLEVIKSKRKELEKEGKIKKIKSLPKLSKEDQPFVLPKSWKWCRFAELGLIASSSRVHKKEWQSEGVPFYRAREIVKLSKFGTVDNDLFITEELFEKHKENGLVPEQNDIMLTGVGTIGVPYVVRESDRFYFKDASVLIFKNLFALNPDFLHLFFLTPFWLEEIHRDSMGTTVHTFTISRAQLVPVAFPPLEEQKAIVAIVNQLFAKVEQLENLTKKRVALKADFVTSALQQLTQAEAQDTAEQWTYLKKHFGTFFTEKESIKKLRESILQLAVQGKLTQQWRKDNPNTEDASILLERIQAEKAQLIADKKIKKEKPLPAITEEEIPYALPEGWVWAISQDLFRYEQGIQVDKNLQLTTPEDGYLRFLRIIDFTQRTDDIRYVKNPGDKYVVTEDNLAMVRYGASAGFIGTDLSGVLANNLFKIHYGILSKEFVKLVFESPYFEQELKLNTKGGAMPAINFGFLNKFIFPLAPLEEQKAIVQKVNALMALCDSLENEIETHQTTQEDWMRSCLREVVERNN